MRSAVAQMLKSCLFHFNRLRYIMVIAVICGVVLAAMGSIYLSQLMKQQLAQTCDAQQRTRSILKINMIFQRGHAQGLLALKSNDPEMFRKSADIMASAVGFAGSGHYFPQNVEAQLLSGINEIADETERINARYVSKAKPVPRHELDSLAAKMSKMYIELSDAEVVNWNELSAKNSKLKLRIIRLKRLHGILTGFTLLIVVMLTWFFLRKEKAEEALQKAKEELEIRVEERTTELRDEIAEHKKAEEALQRRAEDLATLNVMSQGVNAKNTGIGIKDEDIPRLFESFVRLDSPIKTKTLGTGLGLYLTKKIVTEMLKGSVSMDSRYGKGSRFGMRIPKEI